MSKSVQITLEYDSDTDSIEQYNRECITMLKGSEYHEALKEIYVILASYDKYKNGKPKALPDTPQQLLQDFREKCVPHFKGLYHAKKQ